MLILTCPYCGIDCDETELSPGARILVAFTSSAGAIPMAAASGFTRHGIQ